MKTFCFLYGIGIAFGFAWLNTETGKELYEQAKKERVCWKSCVTDGRHLSDCFNVCQSEPTDADGFATDGITPEQRAALAAKIEAIVGGADQ